MFNYQVWKTSKMEGIEEMIDFKTELDKYKPILEVEQVEAAVQSDEMQDLMDVLQHISRNNTLSKE